MSYLETEKIAAFSAVAQHFDLGTLPQLRDAATTLLTEAGLIPVESPTPAETPAL